MPYENTPHVGATYVDGSLKEPVFSTQPKILILAPAESGLSDERFDVGNTGAAESEFGANTELCKGMHETVAQGADNISLMRIGGTLGSWVAEDSDGETLTIVPEFRDDLILERYALFMETVDGENRILIYDLEDQTWVYDSLEILVINDGIVDVDDTGIDLFTIGNIRYPDEGEPLATIVTGDFTAAGTATMSSVTATAGSDGMNMSLPEKYAALNRAYHNLDFQDADYIVPKGVYIDDQNAADGDDIDYFKGVPVAGEANDTLGYVWQYVWQGNIYTYFVDRADYFTAEGSAVAATKTINTDVVYTAQKTGTGGNKISVQHTVTSGAVTVTISEPTIDGLHVLVVGAGTVTTAQIVTAVNNALGAYTMNNGQLASTILQASGGSGAFLATVASSFLNSGGGTAGVGGHVLTHEDLTGDAIPSEVSAKFADGADSQLRECNFAHQLATFCYIASTTWKTMQGAIAVKEMPGTSRNDVAAWVGSPPIGITLGQDQIIDVPADNGTGILGIKLMVGKSASSNGYRAHMIEDGNSTDGYLYGGIIATQGLGLPNESPDWAYGIDDGDEAVDENGFPVDIGKHIHVCVDWPIHRNAFNGGVNYRGSIEASLCGRLATMPDNEEPIGRDFPLKRITSVPRIHASQRDALAKFRFVCLRREEGIGWVFNSTKTAAHKIDSDYTLSSTIRCVNRELSGIRDIAKNYLGKPFSPTRVAALQADIDGFLAAERRDGFNEGAVASLSWSRADKILGKLTIRVKMVPPFTIQLITEVMTLAADETEL